MAFVSDPDMWEGRAVGANSEVVEQAYAAFGKGDIPALIELIDDSVEWSAPETLPQGGSFHGKDGVLKFFGGLGSAWDSLQVDAEAVGDVGADTVVGIVRGTGSLQGGAAAEYGAVHVFTIKGGKITRFREFVDLDRAIGS
ncbi:MAG: nuclear transport factor 2 family protein [Acidimicrobiia bacterium]